MREREREREREVVVHGGGGGNDDLMMHCALYLNFWRLCKSQVGGVQNGLLIA